MIRKAGGREGWSRRPGFTLIEMLLALGISVLLMSALYFAISNQLGLASAGRDAIGGATLTRALVMRITNDVSASITLVDPKRYRDANQAALDAEASADAASADTSGTTGTTSSSTSATSATPAPVQLLPLGVAGDATSLHLFVSKVPNETYDRKDKAAELTSDLRRISYWLGQNGGLCRVEVKLITSESALDTRALPGDESSCMLAPEVKSVEFSYFDGTLWQPTWDPNAGGTDMITPVGPPRAIAVTFSIVLPGMKEGAEPKKYRQVIAVPAANGKDEPEAMGGGM